jgi:hypothetical protein
MKNKQDIKDNKKSDRDCMLVEMYKYIHCSTPMGSEICGHSFSINI